MGWVVNSTLWLLYPGKETVPFVQEAWWAPRTVWTGAENLAPPGFDPRIVQPVASRYTDCATPEGKAIPIHPWTGPEGSRGFRLPDFKTIGT